MNISCKTRRLIICAHLLFLVCGLGGVAARVHAQGANQPTDEIVANRVQTALHVDPYFYDKHVTVSVEKGSVVLRGFVASAWQLQDALRIARKAAGDTPVVDNLSIKLGGR